MNPGDWVRLFFIKYFKAINWKALAFNPSEWAKDLHHKHLDMVNWECIPWSSAPWPLEFCNKHLDKITLTKTLRVGYGYSNTVNKAIFEGFMKGNDFIYPMLVLTGDSDDKSNIIYSLSE